MQSASDQLIGIILKHDKKITSYKIALIRAINDVVLSFPDIAETDLESSKHHSIALPLRMIAEFWVAYYWVFTNPQAPILQGQVAMREGKRRNDVSFRPALEELRLEWEKVSGAPLLASDGFFLLSEFKTPRRRLSYPLALQAAHQKAVRSCMDALQQPIRYAGEGQYTVFDAPQRLKDLNSRVKAVAGTQPDDLCLVISKELWKSFRNLSLWIEALAVHEWCLFSERVATEPGVTERGVTERGVTERGVTEASPKLHRGDIYFLLTARPDNRRPLTWERNRIELLLLEGITFTCPWTQKTLAVGADFDIDHMLPLAIYPINDLWNLLPADREFNQRTKRDRLPSLERLVKAEPLIAKAYANYEAQPELKLAMHEDASLRFSNLPSDWRFSVQLATSTVRYIEEVATARSVARF